MATKTSRHWIVMSIPGRENNDGTETPCKWFAYNKITRKSIRFENIEEARRFVTHPENQ